jgi:hypothetical protein
MELIGTCKTLVRLYAHTLNVLRHNYGLPHTLKYFQGSVLVWSPSRPSLPPQISIFNVSKLRLFSYDISRKSCDFNGQFCIKWTMEINTVFQIGFTAKKFCNGAMLRNVIQVKISLTVKMSFCILPSRFHTFQQCDPEFRFCGYL